MYVSEFGSAELHAATVPDAGIADDIIFLRDSLLLLQCRLIHQITTLCIYCLTTVRTTPFFQEFMDNLLSDAHHATNSVFTTNGPSIWFFWHILRRSALLSMFVSFGTWNKIGGYILHFAHVCCV